jgi:hypothetical protein
MWATRAPICIKLEYDNRHHALSTHRSICHEHCICECAGESGQPIFGQRARVKYAVHEDFGARIALAILSEESCRHEWKRSRTPGIAIIDGEHDEETDDETGSLMELKFERKR